LECGGACGDLGTFIPHIVGAITVAGLSPAGVLFGFATFLIATGAILRAAAASAAHESHLGRHPDRRPATGRGCRRRDNNRRRAAGPRDHRLDRTPGAHRLRDRARKASGRPMSVSLPIANHTDWASRRSRKVGREFHPTSLTKM
jgi:hypothetical protein